MKKTLYSIRHPETWALEIEEPDAESEKLLDDVEKKGVYVPLPGRAKDAEGLIDKTVEIARDMELNVDIERYDDQVVFRFYDAMGIYLGKLRRFFGTMFLLCDTATVRLPKEGESPLPGFHWIITFSYHTHRFLPDEERYITFE